MTRLRHEPYSELILHKKIWKYDVKAIVSYFCTKLSFMRDTSGSSLTFNKIASKSSAKSLNIAKETFSTKNDVFLTYKSQNAKLSGNNLALYKQRRSITAARTLYLLNGFLLATTATVSIATDWLKTKF